MVLLHSVVGIMKISMKHAFVLACVADIAACSNFRQLDEYAVEHNLVGNRQCNADLDRVPAERAEEIPCVTGETSADIKEESNVEEEASRMRIDQ